MITRMNFHFRWGLILKNPRINSSYHLMIFPQKWQFRFKNENFEISRNSAFHNASNVKFAETQMIFCNYKYIVLWRSVLFLTLDPNRFFETSFDTRSFSRIFCRFLSYFSNSSLSSFQCIRISHWTNFLVREFWKITKWYFRAMMNDHVSINGGITVLSAFKVTVKSWGQNRFSSVLCESW